LRAGLNQEIKKSEKVFRGHGSVYDYFLALFQQNMSFSILKLAAQD